MHGRDRRLLVLGVVVVLIGAGFFFFRLSETKALPDRSSLCPEDPTVIAESVDGEHLRSVVETILRDQERAWKRGDAGAWGETFTGDSNFVNILGMRFDGRQPNVERHAELFASIFDGSEISICIVSVRALGQDHASVETVFELTGHRKLPPDIRNTRGESLLTRMNYVLTRTGDGWKIASAQNTAIHPVALTD